MLRSEIDRKISKILFVHDASPACERIANGEWSMAPIRGSLMVRSAAKLRVSNHLALRLWPSFETPRCAQLLRMRTESDSKRMRLSTHLWSSLLVPGQNGIVSSLPWREEIEFAEFLIEADRLVEHP